MKKILYTTMLASSFLLGTGNVSAMEERRTPSVIVAQSGEWEEIQQLERFSESWLPLPDLAEELARFIKKEEIGKIQLDDDLFKKSTSKEIANAINSGHVEELPEFQLQKEISLPELMNRFEFNMEDVQLISINNLINLIPTIDGIKFIGDEKFAKNLFPNIEQATLTDIEALKEKRAARIVKEYKIAQVANDIKEPLIQRLDLQTFNCVIDSILKNDDNKLLELFCLGASYELMHNCSLLAIISGSMKNVNLCIANAWLNKNPDKIMGCALTSGDVNMFLCLAGYYEEEGVNSIRRELVPFISDSIFNYLWCSTTFKADVDFLELLIEEKRPHIAIKFMTTAGRVTGNFDELLLSSARHGCLPIVQYLIKKCQANVEAEGDKRKTPLFFAAENNHLDIVKYLVEECHCNVEAKDNDGETPLNIASQKGHLDIVQYLVEECHANIEAKDNNGLTPLLLASREGHLNIVKYLIAKHECNFRGEEQEEFDFYLNTYIEAKDEWGMVPLHEASTNGHLNIVKYLIEECHANVEAKCNYGGVASLSLASGKGYFDIVQYLVEECHCNVEAKDTFGRTPLHDASWHGHLDIVKYLIEECHCNVEAKDNNDETSLHDASQGGHLDIVKYLIEECHANVEAKDNKGMTPLLLASEYGRFDIVKYLVDERNANVEAKDNHGRTPLGVTKNDEIKEYLQQKSRPVYCLIKKHPVATGMTALTFASVLILVLHFIGML